MCASVCVCMGMGMCVFVLGACVHVRVYACVCMYTCVSACTHVWVHVCMWVHAYMRGCMWLCMHVCMCVPCLKTHFQFQTKFRKWVSRVTVSMVIHSYKTVQCHRLPVTYLCPFNTKPQAVQTHLTGSARTLLTPHWEHSNSSSKLHLNQQGIIFFNQVPHFPRLSLCFLLPVKQTTFWWG